MNNINWVRVGIFAAKELNVSSDAQIIIAPNGRDYVTRKAVNREYVSTTYDTDIVSPQWERYREENGDVWGVGIGYSKKNNVLVIWPESVIK